MNGYQERVIKEKEDLFEKIQRLTMFVDGNDLWMKLDIIDQGLLKEQASIMNKYLNILVQRIKRF